MKWLNYLLIALMIATTSEAIMIINESPYPDFYGENGANDTRIDTNVADGKRISLNRFHYITPTRIGAVPGCSSAAACSPLITNIVFYLNGMEMNTESAYPYDLKYPNETGVNAEAVDDLPEGNHTLKAVVNKVDGTTLEMSAMFYAGEEGSLQQIDDLTLYMMTSDKQIMMSWDLNENSPEYPVTYYDVYVLHVERDERVIKGRVPQPADPATAKVGTFTFTVPRTGHYIAKVRAVVKPLSDNFKAAIDAEESIDSLRTALNNTAICDKEWWLYNNWTDLDAFKAHAKQIDSYCSEWSHSYDPTVASVVRKDGEMVQKGWWLFGYPAAPTGGGIETN